MFDIAIDLSALHQLTAIAARIPAGEAAAVRAAGEHVAAEADRQAARIASQPIPRSGTGRPLWERSGALAASRALANDHRSATVDWTAKYAPRRFGLGYSWMPRQPAGGVVRRANVPADTVAAVEGSLPGVVETAFREAVGL